MVKTCAGCGLEVEQVPLSMGGWGSPIPYPPIGDQAWSMHCWTIRAENSDEILDAGFHYVEGEEEPLTLSERREQRERNRPVEIEVEW